MVEQGKKCRSKSLEQDFLSHSLSNSDFQIKKSLKIFIREIVLLDMPIKEDNPHCPTDIFMLIVLFEVEHLFSCLTIQSGL